MPEINWYPGHMAKSRRMLEEQMRGIDAVIELCDARAPRATRNPMLSAVCKGRARVLVLNKADLANDAATKAWMDFYRAQGMFAVRFTATGGKTREILSFIQEATKEAVERMRARGANKTVRLMVIGVPNVGQIHAHQPPARRRGGKDRRPPGRDAHPAVGEGGTVSGNARYARHALAQAGRPGSGRNAGAAGLHPRPDHRPARSWPGELLQRLMRARAGQRRARASSCPRTAAGEGAGPIELLESGRRGAAAALLSGGRPDAQRAAGPGAGRVPRGQSGRNYFGAAIAMRETKDEARAPAGTGKGAARGGRDGRGHR